MPWPQRGGESVTIPLGTVAPVVGIGKQNTNFPLSNVTVRETGGSGTVIYSRAAGISGDYTGYDHKFVVRRDEKNTSFPAIFADLSDASAYDINTLRFSFQVQRYLERAARGGSRYVEMVRSHFGVVCPDLTYRPEFLGGGTAPIIVTPVAQTSESGTTPQGNLSAFATCVTSGNGFTKSFTEHGFVMGIINVSADLTYQQGVPRMFSRDTILDYYFPVFANLGEQAVLNQEIYAQGYQKSPMAVDPDDLKVFGYQERWAEYRYKPSLITGALRSTYATSLDVWHLSEEFTSLPTLSGTFIKDPTGTVIDRVIAVQDEPQFILDSYISCKCVRPMPMVS